MNLRSGYYVWGDQLYCVQSEECRNEGLVSLSGADGVSLAELLSRATRHEASRHHWSLSMRMVEEAVTE